MRLRKFDRLSRSKSSNVPIGSADLWSCPNAGSSSAPLRGSIAAAAWLKTGSASTERPWHSYASHQFASCSENFAIRPEVSGQTLKTAFGGSQSNLQLCWRLADLDGRTLACWIERLRLEPQSGTIIA